jgi:hypothetical protein
MTDTNEKVHAKLLAVYDSLYRHNGVGEMPVEVRILKKQQKEIIIKCGKQFRYVVDWKNAPCAGDCPVCGNGNGAPPDPPAAQAAAAPVSEAAGC